MKLRFRLLSLILSTFAIFAWINPVKAEVDTEHLKTKLEQIAENMGGDYVKIGSIKVGGLGDGQSKSFEHVLKKGACYQFLAIGGNDVSDLDLRLFSGKKSVARDQGTVKNPVIKFCVKKDTRAKVHLQMFKGKGAFAYGFFAKGQGVKKIGLHQENAARLILETLVKKTAANMQPASDIFTDSIGYRNATTIPVLLDRARCFKFIAVGGTGVQDLSLSVSVDGKEVASDRISGNQPIAQWCSPGRVHANVKVSMYGGSGSFAMQVFGANKILTTSPDKVGGEQTDFISNRIRQLHAQYGKGRATISQVFRGNLSTNNEQVFKVKLSAGHCYTIIGAGNPSVKDLDVLLLDRNKREIQRDKSRNSLPTIDTNPCPSFSGTYMIRAEMIKGFGQFGIQVFSD